MVMCFLEELDFKLKYTFFESTHLAIKEFVQSERYLLA